MKTEKKTKIKRYSDGRDDCRKDYRDRDYKVDNDTEIEKDY